MIRTAEEISQAPPHTHNAAQARNLPVWFALLPVFLLCFLFLTHGMLRESLWADEGWTIAATAEPNPVAVITEWVAVDVHPPLFFVNLNLWRIFTGDTIFEMRYFSVLLTMSGVAVTYRLGRALFSARAGILAALFYGLHDLVKVLTQEVRHYPQQILLSALVMWLYWRWHRGMQAGTPSRGRTIGFVLAGAALLYTHYWGVFVLLALGIHALIVHRHKIGRVVLTFGAIGLLYLPWLPVLYQQITLERPGGLPHALENTQFVYSVLLYQLVGTPELFWLVLAGVGAMGAFALRRWRPSVASWVPLLVALLPPLLSIALNTVYPTLSFRALAVVIPAVMVLAAHGLAQFRGREQIALVGFILLHSLIITGAGPALRPPWPELADYLVDHATEDDVILLELDTDEHAVAYYIAQNDPQTDYAYSESTRVLRPDEYESYMQSALEGHNGIWVAKLGWPPISDIRPELNRRGFVETAPERDFGMHIDRPILVWRLDRTPSGEPVTTFGDELDLMTAEAAPHPDGVTVNLLWSPVAVPTQDYTVSAFVRGPDGAFQNVDAYPQEALTTNWEVDGLYLDSRQIPTDNLPSGEYQVGVQVYYFTDESFSEIENIPAADCSDDPDCRFIVIDTVQVD